MTASRWQKEGRRLGWARLSVFSGCSAVTVVVLGMDACGGGLSETPEMRADAAADAANASLEAGADAANASLEAGADAANIPDGCLIEPTKYDQSCLADEDCIPAIAGPGLFQPIEFGNFCVPSCGCSGYGAIGKTSVAQYQQDVASALRHLSPD